MDYTKCSLLLPMDGANNGTTFTDWSPTPKTITVSGNTKTSTAQSKYYGSSGYFDGTGDYLTASGIDLIGSEFTIAGWLRPAASAASTRIFTLGGSTVAFNSTTGIHLLFQMSSTTQFQVQLWNGSAAYSISATTAFSLNTWVHLAITFDGTTVRVFSDGVLDGSSTTVPVRPSGTPVCRIGSLNPETSFMYNGYIQDLLVIKDHALWTSDFTPPSRLIGELSGSITEGSYSYISKWVVASKPVAALTDNKSTTAQLVTGTTYTVRGVSNVPHQVSCIPHIDGQWESEKTVTLGQFIVPSNPETSAHLWEVTTAGTFGATEASWNLSGTTTQGTAILTFVGTLPNPSILGPKIPS